MLQELFLFQLNLSFSEGEKKSFSLFSLTSMYRFYKNKKSGPFSFDIQLKNKNFEYSNPSFKIRDLQDSLTLDIDSVAI